ncbi:MAG: hypothetical protein AMXMBFR84_40930 [Candidatus Hydrogenedentota bacterium]
MPIDPLTQLCGIVTVLNTPFLDDDSIDVKGLAANVNHAIEAGVAGFLVPAKAGEVEKLSETERALVVETVASTCAGRVPIVGGAWAATGEERQRIVRSLMRSGCAGVLLNIPYENDDQYRRDVMEIAALDPGFIMLQDWDFGGYGLPLPLIVSLFETVPSFRCLKIEVVPAGAKYSETIAATGGRLHVSGGWAVSQMIEGLDRGVHAFMPTGMHWIYTTIYRLFASGDRTGAQALFNRLLPVLAFSNQHLDISVHFFKRLLHAQGTFATSRVREPVAKFDAFHEKSARECIELVQTMEAEIRGATMALNL